MPVQPFTHHAQQKSDFLPLVVLKSRQELSSIHQQLDATTVLIPSLPNPPLANPAHVGQHQRYQQRQHDRPLGETRVFSLAPWLLFLGVSGSVVSFRSSTSGRNRLSVSMRFRIPRIPWRGRGRGRGRGRENGSCVQTKHPRQSPGCTLTIFTADFLIFVDNNPWRIYPGISRGITTVRLIHNTADIVQACLPGNLDFVRRLLQDGNASVYDLTSENDTLLMVRCLNF